MSEISAILVKLNNIIENKKRNLLSKLPLVNKFNDGIVSINYFTQYTEEDKPNIIENHIDNNETVTLYYLPKGCYFCGFNVGSLDSVICLRGLLNIKCDNSMKIIRSHDKINHETTFEGNALIDTYILTTSK